MPNVLTINGGSSSIRFAVFEAGQTPLRLLQGKMDRIGSADACLTVEPRPGDAPARIQAAAGNHGTAVDILMDWLESQPLSKTIDGVGHRVVHGMLHTAPELVTPALLEELKRIIPFDPEHLPREIELIETVQRRFGQLPQVACFDTAFHRSMPRVATQLPIPRRYAAQGIQRYGFHGLSYTFLMQELERLGDPAAAQGRVILAHLGSGASLAAVRDGQCIDTSMGFTPAAGLVMGTRSGDLDPGLMSYLALNTAMSAAQFQRMVNHESGLLGISQSSADVRDLLDLEARDPRAAEALALFCYQAKKWIGSFAAALGGLDTLVFAGGIGENAASVRRRICEGMGHLGIDIDEDANRRHAPRISSDAGSKVTVRVIRTDEESVIASLSSRLLGFGPTQET
ncbi:MAG TPA: acetate/propionate family kinase [Steroidobacteraceae bacterium]|nr:acetate/propionate family kinase [Steroidobacteraceae bacterium]